MAAHATPLESRVDAVQIPRDDPLYPAALKAWPGGEAVGPLMALGDPELLRGRKLALFCSVQCPGALILRTYELAQRLREAGPTAIGGFHSPMEREWLQVLLRGPGPVILCPARSIVEMRPREEYRRPLGEGRLLLLSCFPEEERRVTAETALVRNRFVAALADDIFVAHAEPGGRTEQFCRDLLARAKPLYTLQCDANANLVAMGARHLPEELGGAARRSAE